MYTGEYLIQTKFDVPDYLIDLQCYIFKLYFRLTAHELQSLVDIVTSIVNRDKIIFFHVVEQLCASTAMVKGLENEYGDFFLITKRSSIEATLRFYCTLFH